DAQASQDRQRAGPRQQRDADNQEVEEVPAAAEEMPVEGDQLEHDLDHEDAENQLLAERQRLTEMTLHGGRRLEAQRDRVDDDDGDNEIANRGALHPGAQPLTKAHPYARIHTSTPGK